MNIHSFIEDPRFYGRRRGRKLSKSSKLAIKYGKNYLINGVSKLDFDGSGKIIKHEDYWDASFPLYGTFPFLGLLMKGIKRLVSVKPPK